jgi:hypothetical protein
MDDSRMSKETSPGWAGAFAALGVFFILGYFYQDRTSLAQALTGLGIIALAPHVYFRPCRLTQSFTSLFMPRATVPQPVTWLAMAGIALVFASIGVRWL